MRGSIHVGLLLTLLGISGCATPWQTGLAVAGGVGYAAQAPTTEMEQTYYLGTFDPKEQMPAAVYRITVHGQASMLNNTKFASGWVPARLVDSLGSQIEIANEGKDKAVQFTGSPEGTAATISPGRRMMLFGPEGFREAPADHRLVIVMGSSPDEFFRGADEALGRAKVDRTSKKEVLNKTIGDATARVDADAAATPSIQANDTK